MSIKTNPYTLRTDYKELFRLISENNIIVAFVNKEYNDGNIKHRDVCALKRNHDQITAFARGICYMDIDMFDVNLRKAESLEDLFIRDCEDLELGWIGIS